MAKPSKEQKFSIRCLRNLVGHQDDLATASERLGHASLDTTRKFYRSNTSKVVPMKVSDSDNLADVLKNLSQYRKGTVGEASEGGGSTWNL